MDYLIELATESPAVFAAVVGVVGVLLGAIIAALISLVTTLINNRNLAKLPFKKAKYEQKVKLIIAFIDTSMEAHDSVVNEVLRRERAAKGYEKEWNEGDVSERERIVATLNSFFFIDAEAQQSFQKRAGHFAELSSFINRFMVWLNKKESVAVRHLLNTLVEGHNNLQYAVEVDGSSNYTYEKLISGEFRTGYQKKIHEALFEVSKVTGAKNSDLRDTQKKLEKMKFETDSGPKKARE